MTLKDAHPRPVEVMLEEAGWRLDPQMFFNDAWYYNLCNLAARWRERALTAENEREEWRLAHHQALEGGGEKRVKEEIAKARAAEAEVVRLRTALEDMIDWHERGDQDSTLELHGHFIADLNAARAALAPPSSETPQLQETQ